MENPVEQTSETLESSRGCLSRAVVLAGKSALAVACVVISGWCVLAGLYADHGQGQPRYIFAGIIAVACLTMGLIFRPRKRGVIGIAVLFAAMLVWYFSRKPSNTRDWQPDVSRPPTATINGDIVTIHNIRDFDYRSDTDFTVRYVDKTYDLRKLRHADYILSYWGPTLIAHSMVSFGFEDDQYICMSIETRKEVGETYSAVQGFFRQYELCYVMAMESDVLRVRTEYRGENVYIFRTAMPQDAIRKLFMTYIEQANELAANPQWYNALTSSCMSNIVTNVRSAEGRGRMTWSTVLNGYSAENLHKHGAFDQSMTYEQLKQRGHINKFAADWKPPENFSKLIRTDLPTPPVRPLR